MTTYIRPGFLITRVANPILSHLRGTPALIVRGRRSGRPLTVPMAEPFDLDDRRYLVSGRGETHWVRNLRAAGQAAFRQHGTIVAFRAIEVSGEEHDRVVDAYRRKLGHRVDAYFAEIPDLAGHPVFRMDPIPEFQAAGGEETPAVTRSQGAIATVRRLIGSGDRIGLLVLPFLIGGLILNIANPSLFDVGGPSNTVRTVALLVLIPGVAVWIWSVALILTHVPRGELITSGPYALVKHPLYTDVALFVLPWVGLLLNTWLGILLGAVLYVANRIFAPEEEAALSRSFGDRWDAYVRRVRLPWA